MTVIDRMRCDDRLHLALSAL